MGILNVNSKTKEELLNINKDIMRASVNGIYLYLKKEYENLFTRVWENADGLTPQEVLDSFETDAFELFSYSDLVRQVLVQVNPNYSVPEVPYNFTINGDGTVTVGEAK